MSAPRKGLVISALLLVLVDRGEAGHPRQRRAEPVLPPRHELLALAQDADPHHVGRLRPFAGRGRIDRRTAARAEGLQARGAAVRRGLQVGRRLSGHSERRAGNRNRDAERGSRAGLTIGAMTDRGLVRISLAFDRDVAAVACAVDFHRPLLPPRSLRARSYWPKTETTVALVSAAAPRWRSVRGGPGIRAC